MATFNEYLNHVQTSQERSGIVKIEWIKQIGTELVTVGEITADVLSGTLSIDYQNGVNRSVSMTLTNINQTYVPNEDGRLWFGKYFKLFTGVFLNGENYWVQQGIFALGNPQLSSNFSEQTAQIEAYDFGALLSGEINGTLEYDYIANVGENLGDVIRAVLSDSEVPTSDLVNIDADIENISLPFTVEVNRGSNFQEILNTIANAYVYEWYFDENGIFNFVKPIDQQTQGEEFTLGQNEINYQTCTHNYQFNDMYNAIRIWGDDNGGSVATGYAEDTNVFSPTSIDKIPKKVIILEDTVIQTSALAQERAEYELLKGIQIWESIELNCVPIDHLTARQIVIIDDIRAGLDRRRCQIQNISLPLYKNSSMSMTVWPTRAISDSVFID